MLGSTAARDANAQLDEEAMGGTALARAIAAVGVCRAENNGLVVVVFDCAVLRPISGKIRRMQLATRFYSNKGKKMGQKKL